MERRLAEAGSAFDLWRRTSVAERARLMAQLGGTLKAERDRLARLMTSEMGKTLVAAESEVTKCAVTCDWFAAEAGRLLAPEPAPSDARRELPALRPSRGDPRGHAVELPALAGVPRRGPGGAGRQRDGAQARIERPGCALAIEALFGVAGFPRGVFTTLLLPAARRSAGR